MKVSLVILAVMTVLVPSMAYGSEGSIELENSTVWAVELPKGDSEFRGCHWYATPAVTYACYWDYFTPVEEFREVMDEFAPREPISEEPEITLEVVIPEPEPVVELSPTERLIQSLEKDKEEGTISQGENQLLELLRAAQITCYFGIEEGEANQAYSEHLIPENFMDYDYSLDLSNTKMLERLYKLVEACTHWTNYKAYGLGESYINMMEAQRAAFSEELERQAAIASLSHRYDSLSEHDLIEEQETAHEKLCRSMAYGKHFKMQSGCFTFELPPNRGGHVDTSSSVIAQEYEAAKAEDRYLAKGVQVPGIERDPIYAIEQYMTAYDLSVEDVQELLDSISDNAEESEE